MTPEDMSRLHGAAFERGWSAKEFEDLLLAKGAICATQSAGFALGRVIAGEAEILTIVVDAAQRGAGVGRALLAGLMENAKTGGAEEMFLEVAEDNAPARALYGRAGFEEVGRRVGYYRKDDVAVDALTLRRHL